MSGEIDWEARLDAIETRADLARFVLMLSRDAEARPEEWENPSLPRFLEAMAAWIGDTEDAARGSTRPRWRTFAEMLLAARVYE